MTFCMAMAMAMANYLAMMAIGNSKIMAMAIN